MFFWFAIFGLAASGVYGFPSAPVTVETSTSPAPAVNTSETHDVARLKRIMETVLEHADSNSSSLDTVDKRDVTCGLRTAQCNCSGGQCDCPSGQCKCSDGQCVCPTGCHDDSTKVATSVATGRPKREDDEDEDDDDDDTDDDDTDVESKNKTESADGYIQPAGFVGNYEGRMLQRLHKRSTEQESLEDDDDGDAQNVTVTDPSHRELPRAMLDSEKRLYARSVDVGQVKPDHEEKRAADVSWELELGRLPRSGGYQPDYRDWDEMYPLMNEFRMKRAAKGDEPAKEVMQDRQRTDVPTTTQGSTDLPKVIIVEELDKRPLEYMSFGTLGEGLRKKRGAENSTGKDVSAVTEDQSKTQPTATEKDTNESATSKSEPAMDVTGKAVDESAKDITGKAVDESAKDALAAKNSLTGRLVESGAGEPKTVQSSSNEEAAKEKAETAATTLKTSDQSSTGKPNAESAQPKSEPATGVTVKSQSSKDVAAKDSLTESEAEESSGSPRRDSEVKPKKRPGSSTSKGNAHDADKWQEQRRLGDDKPNFGNLDIRYLGGNDLPIPPVDTKDFNPQDLNRDEEPDEQPPGPAAPLSNVQSGSVELAATCAALLAPLVLLIAPFP